MAIITPLIAEAKKLRIEHGLTQAEISKLSGLTQCRVSKLESGAAIPRLDTFVDYLDASGCVLRIEEKPGWEETATQMLKEMLSRQIGINKQNIIQ